MANERKLVKHNNIKGILFSSQMIIGALVTIVFPLVFSFVLSLTNLKLNLGNLQFTGFDNYAWVFSEESSGFWKATGISVLFSVLSTLVQTILGFFLAMMLYFLGRRLQGIYKTLIYLPVILPSAVVSAMWIMMYSGDQYGIFNILFGMTDPPFQWLSDSVIGMICLIVTNTWRFVGITTVIYLVSLSNVPADIIEAAKIDGASKPLMIRRILLPLTFGATVLNIILSIIGGIKSFDLFYLFQTNGNLSSDLTPVALLIYRVGLGNKDVKNINLGRSLAMSIVLSIILTAVTLIVKGIFKGKEEEE